jgi:putative tryptophan/tyrosine transport system substrate-binding protein
MRELGWIENSNVTFVGFYAEDRQDRLPELAAKLMALHAQSPLLYNHAKRVFDRMTEARIPIATHRGEKVADGALFSYSSSLPQQFRRAAEMVDLVLRGKAPHNMPVEVPTRFELVVNQQAARALGIAIPGTVLLRANQVIE